MTLTGLKIGEGVHLRGYPEYHGPVTEIEESGGVWYAKFRCAVHKREVGWLRFDQLRRSGKTLVEPEEAS